MKQSPTRAGTVASAKAKRVSFSNRTPPMRYVFALAALVIASPAWAADSQTTAIQLGSVLAGEKFCGLSYDQAAIRAFVEKNVRSDDMSFPSNLQTMTSAGELDNNDLSPSAKTAHCTQIERIAKSYGFTK